MTTSPAPPDPKAASALFARIRRSLARDRDLPALHLARKAIQYGAALASAPFHLLACDDVGPGARTRGRPRIDNAGYIAIGARAIINSSFSPVELSAGPGGRLVIGDDLLINSGVVITAAREVTLGHRVSVGPYAIISDTSGDESPSAGPEPIMIGDDAWLASRVRVCKGARIGAGAVISAGSVVVGEIPPNVIAGGDPARVLRACPVKEGPTAEPPESSMQPEKGAAAARDAAGPARLALKRADGALRDALARVLLAGATQVGERPRVHGVPYIENLGQIFIGDDLRLISAPVRARLVTGKGGVLRLGDHVTIGAGASIAATTQIDIGDGATLGPGVMLMDSDYHAVDDRSKKGAAAPIVIEANARLDEGVIVLRGAHIGRNAHIAAGSVVSGTIPEGAFAAGVRARVVAPGDRGREGAR